MLTLEQATERFLNSLEIYGEDRDAADLEYLKEIHFDDWERFSARVPSQF